MKCFFYLFLIFFWFIGTNAQNCTTPLEIRSQCVSIYQCKSLLFAINKNMSQEIVEFLRNSHCGDEGTTPKVCCGPLPANRIDPISYENSNLSPRIDPISHEDSNLSPQGECGIDTNGDRIYGGMVAGLDEYPWMALLGYRTSAKRIRYECGGALINRRYVLTAAHCMIGAIEQKVGHLVTVRLGEYDTDTEIDCIRDDCADPPQEIPVQSTHPHPGYSDSNLNKADDIGLVRLAQRAIYTYYVQPICLVRPKSLIDRKKLLYVAGWGKTEFGQKSSKKLKVEVPVFNKSACINKFKILNVPLTNKQICAGGRENKDSCRGDSGGPLMRKLPDNTWEAIGLVSFSTSCGSLGWPGVYTAIYAYLDWIHDTMLSSNSL